MLSLPCHSPWGESVGVRSVSWCALTAAKPSPREPQPLGGPGAEGEQDDRERDQDEEEPLLDRPSPNASDTWLSGNALTRGAAD
jgi:hypothetical protein